MARKLAILVLGLALFLAATARASPDEASGACRQSYGFLPCTRSAAGNGFLVFVYGYLVYKAGRWLILGSEVLLEINGYGVFGGLFLPLLCSLPAAFVVLACGVFGSQENAQIQASIGMGLVTGSAITLLTLLWGSCVIAGNCHLHHSTSTQSPNTKASILTGYGVVTDHITSHSAWIMVMSTVPFILVMLLQILLPSHSHLLAILISLIVSISLLLCYCLYQIFEPWVQHRRLAYAKYKHVEFVMLWLTETGEPDREAIIKLFKTIDHNSDGHLSATELKALIFGLNFEEIGSNIDDTAQNLLNYFDTSGDSQVDEEEFVRGISKYITSVLHCEPSSPPAGGSRGDRDQDLDRHDQEHALKKIFLPILFVWKLVNGMDAPRRRAEDPTARFKYSLLPKKNKMQLLFDGKVEGNDEDSRSHGSMAMVRLVLGALIAAAFAAPLVEAVTNFSIATTIPPFLVSFLILPFICSTEIFPSLALAARKKRRLSSLIFSEIYRNVTMSNILNLSTFLIIVYVRNLTWNFSPEIIVVVIVCVAMGTFAGFRTTFPLWTCLIAYSSYPLSLALVYVLHFVLGQD